MSEDEHRIRSKAARLRYIEHRLYNAPAGLRAIELAELCGVDRRTIYRDLQLLEDTGVPIWQQNGRLRHRTQHLFGDDPPQPERSCSSLLRARLLSHHSDEHNPHIVAALDKLAASLPDQAIAANIARLADIVRSRPAHPRYVSILETLTRGWIERRVGKIQPSPPLIPIVSSAEMIHAGERKWGAESSALTPVLLPPGARGADHLS